MIRSIRRLLLPALVAWAAMPAAAQEFPADTTRVLADQQLVFDTNLGLLERATAEAVAEALEGLSLPPGSEVRLHSLTDREGAWFVEDHIARFLSDRGYRIYFVKPEEPAAAGAVNPAAAAQVASGGSMADAFKVMSPGQPAAADSGGAAGAGAVVESPDREDDDESGSNIPAGAQTGPAGGPRGNRPGRPGGPATGPGARNNVPEEEVLIPIPKGEGLVLTFRLIEFGVTYHDSWRRGFLGPRVVERLASVNIYTRLVSGDAESVLWVGGGRSQRLDVVPKAKLDLLEGQTYPFSRPTLPVRPFSRVLEPALVLGIVGGLVFLFYSNQN